MEIITAKEIPEGGGVTVRRLFPFHRDELAVDPFVLWDDFSITPGSGFPTHAHRGFEAITYLFEGSMNHADNLGNNSTVLSGGAQRFTAGKGIQHSEMPGDEGVTQGIQLWINLPRELKGIDPEYQQVDADQFPTRESNGVIIRQLVGRDSPLQIKTHVEYLDITMRADSTYDMTTKADMQGLIYLHDGEITVNGQILRPHHAALVSYGEHIALHGQQDSRLIVALGRPHHEPVYLSGGFVD